MQLSNLIYDARVAKKLTRKQVEGLAGVDQKTLLGYENGKAGAKIIRPERMSLTNAVRLASALGIPLQRFVEVAISEEKKNGKAKR